MKKLIVLLLGVIFLSGCVQNKYKVAIHYCDHRPTDTIFIVSPFYPEDMRIDTYREAMPRYGGKVNVCHVECIQQITNY